MKIKINGKEIVDRVKNNKIIQANKKELKLFVYGNSLLCLIASILSIYTLNSGLIGFVINLLGVAIVLLLSYTTVSLIINSAISTYEGK